MLYQFARPEAVLEACREGRVPTCGRGLRMEGLHTRKDGTHERHFHYACATRRQRGKDACFYSRTPNARKIEVEVWEAVKAVLLDPGRLERGLDAYLEAEKEKAGGDPEKEARVFTSRIAEVDRKRASYQDLVADGLIGE
jgi:hypothetical protein